VSTRVDRCLADLAREVARRHPDVWSSFSRLRSDFFPFGANVGFGRGDRSTADEDVVVSVSGHVEGDSLRMYCDVSRGDGYVFADGPTVTVPVREAKTDLMTLLESWLVGLEAFLRDEATPLAVRELAAAR
jgi:hypothetical protein